MQTPKKQEEKKIFFLGSEEIKTISDRHLTAEIGNKDSIFIIVHRPEGVGDSFLRTSLHWHNYYEFEFVYGGSGTHILGASSCSMENGFVCLRTPQMLHSTIQDRNHPLRLYNLKFSENFLPEGIAAHLMANNQAFYTYYTQDKLNNSIRQINCAFSDININDDYSPLIAKAVLTELIVDFLRQYHVERQKSNYHNNHIRDIVRYIDENFRSDLSINALAKRFYLTPNYLGTLFAREMGQSCASYIQNLRFRLAIQLLINTNHSVKEITEHCGFHSTSYFIRRFKETFGISPLTYRESKIAPEAPPKNIG